MSLGELSNTTLDLTNHDTMDFDDSSQQNAAPSLMASSSPPPPGSHFYPPMNYGGPIAPHMNPMEQSMARNPGVMPSTSQALHGPGGPLQPGFNSGYDSHNMMQPSSDPMHAQSSLGRPMGEVSREGAGRWSSPSPAALQQVTGHVGMSAMAGGGVMASHYGGGYGQGQPQATHGMSGFGAVGAHQLSGGATQSDSSNGMASPPSGMYGAPHAYAPPSHLPPHPGFTQEQYAFWKQQQQHQGATPSGSVPQSSSGNLNSSPPHDSPASPLAPNTGFPPSMGYPTYPHQQSLPSHAMPQQQHPMNLAHRYPSGMYPNNPSPASSLPGSGTVPQFSQQHQQAYAYAAAAAAQGYGMGSHSGPSPYGGFPAPPNAAANYANPGGMMSPRSMQANTQGQMPSMARPASNLTAYAPNSMGQYGYPPNMSHPQMAYGRPPHMNPAGQAPYGQSMAARAGMVSHNPQHGQYPMAGGYGDRYGTAMTGGLPSASPAGYAMQARQQPDDDDGEIVNRRALAKAESEKSKTKKKRKREGDDDDDEDFTGFDDGDWQPGKKGGKNKKRHLGWEDTFPTRNYPIPTPIEPAIPDQGDMGDSLVATRPRRERRATLKYREALDSDDDEAIDDGAYEAGTKKTPRGKGRNQSSQGATAGGSSGSASGSIGGAASQQFSPRGKTSSSLLSVSTTADEEEDEMYGFEAERRTNEDGEMDDEEGHAIDKVLDYREYVDDDSVAMNLDGSIEKGGVVRTKTEVRGDMNQTSKVNKEYRIKWRGLSYRHCTWESYEALQGVKGTKKLENYVKTAIKESEFRKHATREELEPFDIEQEMLQDLYDEHLKVDRVISYRTPEATPQNPRPSPEYLCVWSKLPYVEATWERAEDITAFQSKIDQYLARSQQQLLPRTYYGPRVARPSFREVQLLQSTPTEWLKGGILRDYQLQGINWLVFSWCNSTNCILADEMGLGKTIQTISFLGFLQFRQKIPGPFLIVVPLSTIANWESEFAKWLPDMNAVVYMGDSRSRELIREHEFYFQSNGKVTTKFNALITSYEIILKDKQHLGSIKWNYLAVDEAHRLKNSGSALHEVLNDFTTSSRLLITGTPLQNSLKELWALLNFLEPRFFPSLEIFERDYSTLEGESQLAALHQRLKPHVLRRFKSQVEKSLPAKNERILRVGMAPMQRKYYRWVITRNFAELNRGLKGQAQSTLSNIVIELKKVCNHPFLFPSAEDQARTLAVQQAAHGDTKAAHDSLLDTLIRSSGKLMLLDKLLVRLKETGHRVLIFSQMVRMLDLLGEYLRLRGFLFQRLDGSMTRSARQMAMESFNAEGSKDFCFILSTRAGGLGINLSTADTVIIFDSDWNPQNDLQAQSRAHRIGQKHVVNIYRLLVKDSVEEDILERAKKKLVLDHLVIQRMSKPGGTNGPANGAMGGDARAGIFSKGELADIIRFGAEELFKAKEDDQFDPHGHPVIVAGVKNQLLDDMDIDDILARAEPGPETVVPGMELLSAFKVASFDTGPDEDEDAAAAETKKNGADDFWDRIVPAELRTDRKASEVIVTGPRSRKKRMENLDMSSEIASPPRARARRAASGKASELLAAEAEDTLNNHPAMSSHSTPATTAAAPALSSSSSAQIKKSHSSLTKSESEGMPNDDEDEDAGDDDADVGVEEGGGSNKKKRKRSERKKPSSDDEMDASDVRKLLVAVRTIGVGDLEKLVQQAGLTAKRAGVVETTLNDIIAQCQTCVEEAAKAQSYGGASAAPALNASGSAPAPGDETAKSKSTTIKYLDVTINAAQLLARINDLLDLNAQMAAYPDPYAFRLNVIVKPWTSFTTIWSSPVDDAMLLLGVHLYGFGQWTRIQADAKLGLSDKILGASQPSAAQLPNRVESLFKVLRDAKDKADAAAGGQDALEMPKKAKRTPKSKADAAAAKASGGASSTTTTPKATKPKTPKSAKNAKASEPAVEDQAFSAELESHVSALWTTSQPVFAAKYRAIVAIEAEEEKLVSFRRFITELRLHIALLMEISATMLHVASFSQADLVNCLWVYASVHICESTKTGKWLQTAGEQLATLSETPPPQFLADATPPASSASATTVASHQQQQHTAHEQQHPHWASGLEGDLDGADGDIGHPHSTSPFQGANASHLTHGSGGGGGVNISETTTSSASTTMSSELPNNVTPPGSASSSSWTDSAPISMPATLPPLPMIIPTNFDADHHHDDNEEGPNHLQFMAVDEHLAEAH